MKSQTVKIEESYLSLGDILKALKEESKTIQELMEIVPKDISTALKSVKKIAGMRLLEKEVYADFDENLLNDERFAILACELDMHIFPFLPLRIRSNPKIVLRTLKHFGWILKYVPEEIRLDQEVVSAALSKYGMTMEHASGESGVKVFPAIEKSIPKNPNTAFEIMEKVKKKHYLVKDNYAAFDESLLDNEEFALQAIDLDIHSFRFLSVRIRGIRDIVLSKIAQHGWFLRYLPEELQDDRDLVLTAVSQYGWTIEYASDALKNDREIVFTAVSLWGEVLKHASEELRNDQKIVLAAVRNEGSSLAYASEEIKHDREAVRAALSNNAKKVWEHVPEELKSDPTLQRLRPEK